MFNFPFSLFNITSSLEIEIPNATYIYLSPNHSISTGTTVTSLTNLASTSLNYSPSVGSLTYNSSKNAVLFNNATANAGTNNSTSLFGTGKFTIYFVIEAVTLADSVLSRDGLWESTTNAAGLYFSYTGLAFYCQSEGVSLSRSIATNIKYLVTITFNQTLVTLQVNNTAINSIAKTSLNTASYGTMEFGRAFGNFYLSSFIIANDIHTNTVQNNIKQYLINTYNIKLTTTTINFDSLGGNDIFYYLGTNGLTTTWVNPISINLIETTASTIGGGTVDMLTNRTTSEFYCTNVANSWIKFNFGIYNINPNYYVIRARSGGSTSLPRNWKLQGSNDDTNWIDLDTRTGDASLTTANQFAGFTCSSTTAYRYIRILMTGLSSTGNNFFSIGEFYIYGNIS